MSVFLLWIIAALHGGQVIVEAWHNNWPVALMMLGFTVADLGILWVARQ